MNKKNYDNTFLFVTNPQGNKLECFSFGKPCLEVASLVNIDSIKIERRHDIQHNDIQHNDTKQMRLTCDTLHK